MLCEFSEDIASLFREGEEADFFRNPNEMLEKIRIYLSDDHLRTAISEAGFRRVYQDGHDIVSRVKYVMDKIQQL
jgi:spore maturation protein CgeB